MQSHYICEIEPAILKIPMIAYLVLVLPYEDFACIANRKIIFSDESQSEKYEANYYFLSNKRF